MFTTIRRYRVKLGQADQAMRLVEGELVPMIRAIPGFSTYQLVFIGPQSLVSISTYQDREAANAANAAAARWVEGRLSALVDGPANVTVGEVRLSAVSGQPNVEAPALV